MGLRTNTAAAFETVFVDENGFAIEPSKQYKGLTSRQQLKSRQKGRIHGGDGSNVPRPDKGVTWTTVTVHVDKDGNEVPPPKKFTEKQREAKIEQQAEQHAAVLRNHEANRIGNGVPLDVPIGCLIDKDDWESRVMAEDVLGDQPFAGLGQLFTGDEEE